MTLHPKKAKVVELCAGVQGWGKGSKAAGDQSVYVLDNWDVAMVVHEANLAGRSKFGFDDYRTTEGVFDLRSIEEVVFADVKRAMDSIGWREFRRGDIHKCLSGTPCKDFSPLNRVSRANFTKWTRLMLQQVRVACTELGVLVPIFEQVPGFFDNEFSDLRKELETIMRKAGHEYVWHTEKLNSKYYNCCQQRERVIIMGVHRDLNKLPDFPKPGKVNPANYLHNLLPNLIAYIVKREKKTRHGNVKYEKEISTYNNLFHTLNATDKLEVIDINEGRRFMSVQEYLTVCQLKGYNVNVKNADGKLISMEEIITLLGNMVQINFSKAINLHVNKEILKL